jgi:PRTRC genetic system protein C
MTAPTLLARKFRMGATLLDDVDAKMTPVEVIAFYVPNYPFLAGATLSEPVVEGATLVYTIIKPGVQVKGARAELSSAATKALKDIRAWSDQPVMAAAAPAHWLPIFRMVERSTSQAATTAGVVDPFLIPMA